MSLALAQSGFVELPCMCWLLGHVLLLKMSYIGFTGDVSNARKGLEMGLMPSYIAFRKIEQLWFPNRSSDNTKIQPKGPPMDCLSRAKSVLNSIEYEKIPREKILKITNFGRKNIFFWTLVAIPAGFGSACQLCLGHLTGQGLGQRTQS